MDALAALALQIEWGADEALADLPRGRRARDADPSLMPALVLTPAPTPQPATALARARSLAAGAVDRDGLRAALAGFDDCPLRSTATRLVFEAGDPASPVVLIADVPGAAEDRAGVPFAGPAGAFLDGMLASIGLSRDTVFATSLLPWRPPGDRKPTDAETQLCLPFLLRHLALLRPACAVVMGALAVRTLLPSAGRRPQGRWHTLDVPGLPTPLPALALSAPAHIQATPAAKRDAWADLIRLRRKLDNPG